MSYREAQLRDARLLNQQQEAYLASCIGADRFYQIQSEFRQSHRRMGPSFGQPRGNGVDFADAAYWLELCSLLARPASEDDVRERRGFTIACKLTGLYWGYIAKALTDVRHSGPLAAALAWAPYMKDVDDRYVGVIYTARVVGLDDPVKLGFSTRADKRMKELSRAEGKPVELIETRPATMLAEWAAHFYLWRNQVPGKPEWYPRGVIFDWLISDGTQREMVA